MEEESILWHDNGESLTGLVPITPPPYPHGHPSEGRQYYYANEERQKRLARFFSAVDEQAAAGVGPGGSPLTEAEFRTNRQKVYATFIQQFRALRQKRIQGTEGYLIHSFRERIMLRIQQKYEVFLENREPVIVGDRVIGALNADGRGLDTLTPYASTSDGKSLLRFLNQPTLATSIRAFGSPQKAMAVYGEDPNLKSQPSEGFEYYDGSSPPPPQGCTVEEEFTSYTWRQDKDHPGRDAIVPVQNQLTCGCCWALCTATSASDAFAIAGFVKKTPMLSWTALLACAPSCQGGNCSSASVKDGVSYTVSRQCGGGNFVAGAQWVKNQGLVTQGCICYQWCESNDGCKGTSKTASSMPELNKLIPGCNTCNGSCLPAGGDAGDVGKTRFFLKNVTSQALKPNQATNATAVQNHIDMVQAWLKTKGGVIATFIVYKNFMLLPNKNTPTGGVVAASATSSNMSFVTPKNPGGVYLEFVGADDKRMSNLSNTNILGAHAVSIIGFSTDPVHWSLLYPSVEAACKSKQKMDKNGFIKISSWVVRNSWGSSWNDKGYVKFATVPFNMSSCLDMTVQISTGTGNVGSGGMMLLEAGTVDYHPNPVFSAGDFTTASIIKTNKDLVEKALTAAGASSGGASGGGSGNGASGGNTEPAPVEVPAESSQAPATQAEEDITGGAPAVEENTPVVLIVPAAAAEGYVREIETLFPHCGGSCRPTSSQGNYWFFVVFLVVLVFLMVVKR